MLVRTQRVSVHSCSAIAYVVHVRLSSWPNWWSHVSHVHPDMPGSSGLPPRSGSHRSSSDIIRSARRAHERTPWYGNLNVYCERIVNAKPASSADCVASIERLRA